MFYNNFKSKYKELRIEHISALGNYWLEEGGGCIYCAYHRQIRESSNSVEWLVSFEDEVGLARNATDTELERELCRSLEDILDNNRKHLWNVPRHFFNTSISFQHRVRSICAFNSKVYCGYIPQFTSL